MKLQPALRVVRLWDSVIPSGNSYKVRLLLAHLGERYALEKVDILRGESRTPEFLARNPAGKVPVAELEDGSFLPESNAILWYLAEGTPYLPERRLDRAQVLRWLCFEQYSHEPNVATVRFWRYSGQTAGREAQIEDKMRAGHQALSAMEQHLGATEFFVDARYGIADIALYAYTHVASEGGFDLERYPAVRAWLERVRSQPEHVEMR